MYVCMYVCMCMCVRVPRGAELAEVLFRYVCTVHLKAVDVLPNKTSIAAYHVLVIVCESTDASGHIGLFGG